MTILNRLWLHAPILVRAVLTGSLVGIAGTVPWALPCAGISRAPSSGGMDQ